MANYDETMQKMVDRSYDELVGIAKRAMAELIGPCREMDPKTDGSLMMISIILTAIGADGKLTALERRMLGDVLDMTDEQISGFIKMYDSDMVELVDKFADVAGIDVKAAVMILVSAIAAVDETINREENAFIRRIME